MHELAADPVGRRAANRQIFDALAPDYDRINRLLSFGRDGAWKDAMVRTLPAADRPLCVDLACGTGDVALRLARRFPAGRVVGVDLSGPMLGIARRRDTTGRIEWRRADLAATGLPDAFADIVTGAYALRLADRLEAGLAEAARLLRPGGAAAFLDFASPDAFLARRTLIGLLEMWTAAASRLFGGPPGAHRWIPATLRHVPPRSVFARMLFEVGFEDVRRRGFFFGAMDLWTARRR